MRFGVTVLLFVCVTAYVAAFPRNQNVFKRQAGPPTPTTAKPDENTWPYGLLEFASLYAKCHEMEQFMKTITSVVSEDMDPDMGTDPDMGMDHDMGTLAIACNDVLRTLEKIKMDASTADETAAIAGLNNWFPLLQCTNFQIDREQTISILGKTTSDDPFLVFTAGLAEMCEGVFDRYNQQKKNPATKRY